MAAEPIFIFKNRIDSYNSIRRKLVRSKEKFKPESPLGKWIQTRIDYIDQCLETMESRRFSK